METLKNNQKGIVEIKLPVAEMNALFLVDLKSLSEEPVSLKLAKRTFPNWNANRKKWKQNNAIKNYEK